MMYNLRMKAHEAQAVFAQEQAPDRFTEALRQGHYLEIPHTITREGFESAVDTFRDFCELPPEIQNLVSLPGENGRGKGSLGYIERTPEQDKEETKRGKQPEWKQYFHYNPNLIDTLIGKNDERIDAALEHEEVQALLDHMHRIWVDMEVVAYNVIHQLQAENSHDERYENLVERVFPDGITHGNSGRMHPKIMIRLMRYLKVEDGWMSANGHWDAGLFTLSPMESKLGLWTGSKEEPEYKNLVRRPDGVILGWPGISFTDHVDTSVPAQWHGVDQLESDDSIAIGEEARWVCVCFIDEFNENHPSVDRTHGVV